MYSDNDYLLPHSEDHMDSHASSNKMPVCSIIQECDRSRAVCSKTQQDLVSDEKLEKVNSAEDVTELRQELQQTRALVTDLETRLGGIERTSQTMVGELKKLIDEIQYGSESHSTVVDNDQLFEPDFYSAGFNKTLDFLEQNLNCPVPPPTQTVKLSSSMISTPCCPSSPQPTAYDDDDFIFERISTTLQSLIHDAERALDQTSKYLDVPKRRSRASSWSSSVSSWIVNKYSPTPSRCGNECCLSCEQVSSNEKQSAVDNFNNCVCNKEELTQRQLQIRQYYRQQLESHSDYTKSCSDLDNELQKLVNIALSSNTIIDEQQTHHKEGNLYYYNSSNINSNSSSNFSNNNDNAMGNRSLDLTHGFSNATLESHGQLKGIHGTTTNTSKPERWISWEFLRSRMANLSNYIESYINTEATIHSTDTGRLRDEKCSEVVGYNYDGNGQSYSSAHHTSSNLRRSSTCSKSHTLNINPNFINIRATTFSSFSFPTLLSAIIHPKTHLLQYMITSAGVVFSIVRTLLEHSSTKRTKRLRGVSTGINVILNRSTKRREARHMVGLLKYLIILSFGWILGRGSISRKRITQTSISDNGSSGLKSDGDEGSSFSISKDDICN